jgi:hypothetical protein
MPLATWLMNAGPLSDPMLLGTQNRGIISLASAFDTSVAFSMWVGYASTQPDEGADHHQEVLISFAWLDLSEVHL